MFCLSFFSYVGRSFMFLFFFFFNDTATTEIYTLSLHDALPIWSNCGGVFRESGEGIAGATTVSVAVEASCANTKVRSEEHTSELRSPDHLVCRLLLEKKKVRMK